MSEVMRKAAAFVPAHISGFFQPCFARTPERTGSRNCGPCLDVGVTTEVRVKPASRSNIEIFINGEHVREARTTSTAVNQLIEMTQRAFEVKVNHFCQIPVGAGYGASGAGALGAVLALSRALGMRVSLEKLARIAHVAEVTCRTGLGDVGAQVLGGLVIGVQPGTHPHGRWRQIWVPRNLKIVCANIGPLSTKEFLSDSEFIRRAGKLGEKAIEKVMKKPTPKEFMLASREFADGLGLLDDELRGLIRVAESAGAIGASQVMIGKAIFAFVRGQKVKRVAEFFSDLLSSEQVIISQVSQKRATLL